MIDRTGSVEQTTSGRWRVRIRLAGVGRKTIDTFDTCEEAEAYCGTMADILDEQEEDTGIGLGEFGDGVLTKRELGGLISDPKTDWSRWNKHIKADPIATTAIRSLRDTHVEDWLERLLAKGLSRQSRIHCLNLLRVVMRVARKKRLIKENPCQGIRLEVDKRTEDPWTFATPQEQDAIIAATPKPLDAIVEFAIGTGLRSGELVSLRLADVHLDGPDPYVTVRYGGPPNKPTKWGRIRQVPLFDRSLAALRRWLGVLPSYCPKNRHGLVFPALRGGFRSHDHAIRWAVWKGSPQRGKPGDRNYHAATAGILTRAGITRTFRWHDLRHTCASSLVSGWWGRKWSLKEVCDLLGHRSITTTERYAHLADTALKQAARETDRSLVQDWSTRAVSVGNNCVVRRLPKPKVASSRLVSRSVETIGDCPPPLLQALRIGSNGSGRVSGPAFVRCGAGTFMDFRLATSPSPTATLGLRMLSGLLARQLQ